MISTGSRAGFGAIIESMRRPNFIRAVMVSLCLLAASAATAAMPAHRTCDVPTRSGSTMPAAVAPIPARSRSSAVVIDLDGDGLDMLSFGAAHFDLNGDWLDEKTTWPGPGEGLLAMDRNGNGRIDDGTELFGNRTPLACGGSARDGRAALATLDGNGDGVIDASDAAYAKLEIWRDRKRRSVSQPEELESLAGAGVVAIRLEHAGPAVRDSQGDRRRCVGAVRLDDGRTVSATEVLFKVNLVQRVPGGRLPLPLHLLSQPNVGAFGVVRDLRQAMALDPGLQPLLDAYVSAANAMPCHVSDVDLFHAMWVGPGAILHGYMRLTYWMHRDARLDALIYRWAGAAKVDPHARDRQGHHIDARRIAVLEHLTAAPWIGKAAGNRRQANPLSHAAHRLDAEYLKFRRHVAANILAQTRYGDMLDSIRSTFGSQAQTIAVLWPELHASLGHLYDAGDLVCLYGAIKVMRDLGTYHRNYRRQRDTAFASMARSDARLAPFLQLPQP